MRIAVVLAVLCLAACASNKLALAPPAYVDLTGNWRLNAADSDDPLRLSQTQIDAAGTNNQSGSSGSGGRGGRRGGGGMPSTAGPAGPATPSIGALGAGLRWPGKDLQIKQIAGVAAFSSDGRNIVFQPAAAQKEHHRRGGPAGEDELPQGRDMPAQGRDVPPPVCGWDGKTLVVRSVDPDDDQPPFEQRYSVSEDGQRLVEVVSFRGGRSGGFTMSRVWDRVQ
jgi:hypothetical protein